MTEIERELATQPACWEAAASKALMSSSMLPLPGQRVALVGCGSSFFMAQAYAAKREAEGYGETDAFPASEFRMGRPYDHLIAISRSGTTTEVIRALTQSDVPLLTTAITAVPDTPIGELAVSSIVLDFADERSLVQTRSATSALALLRAHLGEDLRPAIDDARVALDESLGFDPSAVSHVAFLGHGWSVGIANEGALKLREAAQVHTEAYPAMEYRHGPIAMAGTSSVVWILGSPDLDLAEEIRATGATVIDSELDPMAELVRIQRAAVALASVRGLDPDRPRRLSRSVVLGAHPYRRP